MANVETGQTVTTTDLGLFVLPGVAPGKYTLVISKDGYVRQVRSDVVVTAGRLTEVEVQLAGEFVEMEEFVVQDALRLGGAGEVALLQLRLESPALMDSISSDLISLSGSSDAASALRLIPGASVQDGKSAVIRGLPDRYVSSQINGVRQPSADEDKRAVELDQFPAAVVDSIQVTKTFTPDSQGDASGGAVNVVLKDIPDEGFIELKTQIGYDTQATGESRFLTYDGGGVDHWGKDKRDPQLDKLGQSWDGAVGVSEGDAPTEYKWSLAAGGKKNLGDGVRIGGLASFFYERDSAYFDDAKEDSWWVESPGGPMTPQTNQGSASSGDFKTSLFDIIQSQELVQWGGLAAVGIESEHHAVALSYLYTRTAQDTTTLAEDTRGKEHFFPGYDPTNPMGTGNEPANINAAPYLRLETLEYTERTTGTLQLKGRHELPWGSYGDGGAFDFGAPVVDWIGAYSTADLYQPDKRQFGSLWLAPSFNGGVPPFIPPFTTDPTHLPYKPGANFNLGNLQRIWKEIDEESKQASLNLTLPFKQWDGYEGYVKTGLFQDRVDRVYDQDTFSNFGDSGSSFTGGWEDFWSKHFPSEDHPITASDADVDYDGELDISAYYAMVDMPLSATVTFIGGARFETTEISIVNQAEADALWFPPNATAPTQFSDAANVDFDQDDVLPSAALVIEPVERWTVRLSYSETIARQTFKELTPIIQQEFLGGPIFIGNPDLGMSRADNYDLRLDFTPYPGGLLSASYFYKDIEDPIEYVQRVDFFEHTTAVNYPEGELHGLELEVRQDLGRFSERLQGLAIGANATFIDAEVRLTQEEIDAFSGPALNTPMTHRDMTNAPEHLYNLYATYDHARTGTQLALFYTVQGDTLITGAAESNGNFVPSIYAEEYGTLNLSLVQRLGEHLKLQFQAKNLTDPEIEEVYRSEYIEDDVARSSYTKGIEFSLSVGANFSF